MNRTVILLLVLCLTMPLSNAFLFELLGGLFGGLFGGGSGKSEKPSKPKFEVPPLGKIARSFDGSGNNQRDTSLGKSQSEMPRLFPATYADDQAKMIDRGNPRQLSNTIGALDVNEPAPPNKRGLTMLFVLFGQFIDHDIDLTLPSGTEKALIKVPKGDIFFDSKNQGNKNIQFSRSLFVLKNKKRNFLNQITSFIDGSQVYGSDEQTAKGLRQMKNGKLKMPNNMLNKDSTGAFMSGDVRTNENIGLTSILTIFSREHNRQCEIIQAKFPDIDDETIYMMARNKITGFIQKIAYTQYLPRLLGQETFDKIIGEYRGYNETVNPSIPLQFSTAAYRIGHPLLADSITLFDYSNKRIRTVEMKDMFMSFQALKKQEEVDFVMNGLMRSQCKQRNNQIVHGLRNLLLEFPGIIQDLFSMNVQRGRDHGMPDYNSVRRMLGITPLRNMSEICKDRETVRRLSQAYGNVNNIDLWVGIISQQALKGGSLGAVGAAIVGQTFRNLRNGDRLWYLNAYPQDDIDQIEQTTFRDIILRNSKLSNIPEGFVLPNFVQSNETAPKISQITGLSNINTNNFNFVTDTKIQPQTRIPIQQQQQQNNNNNFDFSISNSQNNPQIIDTTTTSSSSSSDFVIDPQVQAQTGQTSFDFTIDQNGQIIDANNIGSGSLNSFDFSTTANTKTSTNSNNNIRAVASKTNNR